MIVGGNLHRSAASRRPPPLGMRQDNFVSEQVRNGGATYSRKANLRRVSTLSKHATGAVWNSLHSAAKTGGLQDQAMEWNQEQQPSRPHTRAMGSLDQDLISPLALCKLPGAHVASIASRPATRNSSGASLVPLGPSLHAAGLIGTIAYIVTARLDMCSR